MPVCRVPGASKAAVPLQSRRWLPFQFAEYLLEDPRVDPLPFAGERLSDATTPALDPAARTILMRQPAVARGFAITDSSEETATGGEAAPLRLHSYTSLDAAAMCAAAWRRRQSAVLARASEPR